MESITNNIEYMRLVSDIYNNNTFSHLKDIEHHGSTRFDHSLRVSYCSYLISKFLKLDYKETARAGLLHDFFFSDNDRNIKERLISTFTHPKFCVANATSNFDLSEREIDIIRSHMFPIYLSVPKYAESWIVSLVDKCVATYEFSKAFSCKLKLKYVTNAYLIFLINFLK